MSSAFDHQRSAARHGAPVLPDTADVAKFRQIHHQALKSMFSPYKHGLRIAVAQLTVVDVQAAPAAGSRELSRIAAQLVAEPWLWWPRVRYQASQRFYTRVSADETYEAWLLTWLPGQSTGLHDHGG